MVYYKKKRNLWQLSNLQNSEFFVKFKIKSELF